MGHIGGSRFLFPAACAAFFVFASFAFAAFTPGTVGNVGQQGQQQGQQQQCSASPPDCTMIESAKSCSMSTTCYCDSEGNPVKGPPCCCKIGGATRGQQEHFATPNHSTVDGQNFNSKGLYVRHPDPKDKTKFACCERNVPSGLMVANYSELNCPKDDVSCASSKLGEDECDSCGSDQSCRKECCDKIYEKGDKPCLWFAEMGKCADKQALAGGAALSHTNNQTGYPTKVHGDPQNICNSSQTLAAPPNPYKNTHAQYANHPYKSWSVGKQLHTQAVATAYSSKSDHDGLTSASHVGGGRESNSSVAFLHGMTPEQVAHYFGVRVNDTQFAGIDEPSVVTWLSQIKHLSPAEWVRLSVVSDSMASLPLPAPAAAPHSLSGLLGHWSDALLASVSDELSRLPGVNKATAQLEQFAQLGGSAAAGGAGGSCSMLSSLGGGTPYADKKLGWPFNMDDRTYDGNAEIKKDTFAFNVTSDCSSDYEKVAGRDCARPLHMMAGTPAYLTTPAYAKYNPKDFPPGEEKKLAAELEGKTLEQIAEAKRLGNPLLSSAFASLPLGTTAMGGMATQYQGLIEKLTGAMASKTSNSKITKFHTALDSRKKNFNLNPIKFFAGNAGGLGNFLNGGGKSNFTQIIQQIFQGCGGGGGGGGGGSGSGGGGNSSCNASLFGDIDLCLESLSAPTVNGVAASTQGCSPLLLQCLSGATGGVRPYDIQICLSQIAEDYCGDSSTSASSGSSGGGGGSSGGGGGGGGGGSGSGGSSNQMLSQLQSVFGNIGSFNSMADLKQGLTSKTLDMVRQNPFSQIFDPSHLLSPLPHMTMFNHTRKHSAMASLNCTGGSKNMASLCGGGPATKFADNESPSSSILSDLSDSLVGDANAGGYTCSVCGSGGSNNIWYCAYYTDQGGQKKYMMDSVRCSGTLDDIGHVNTIFTRYDENNCDEMLAHQYNRWLHADACDRLRCTPNHVCAPKPCRPGCPGFDELCWGPPAPPCGIYPACMPAPCVSGECPPRASRFNAVDRAFDNRILCCPGGTGACTKAVTSYGGFSAVKWTYTPYSQSKVSRWKGGDWTRGCKEKHRTAVCEQIAAPVPIINKFATQEMVQAAAEGEMAPENTLVPGYTGNMRPFIELADTNKEPEQTGRKPNLAENKGAWIMFAGHKNTSDNNPKNSSILIKNSSSSSAVAAIEQPSWLSLLPSVAQNAFANVASSGVGNLNSAGNSGQSGTGIAKGQGCALGGAGQSTDPGCKVDPSASQTNIKWNQSESFSRYGQSCLPRYEKAFSAGDAEAFASNCAAGNYNLLLDKPFEMTADQQQTERAILRAMTWPARMKGHPMHVKASERHPYGGDGNITVETGLQKLAEMGVQAGGAIIMLTDGGGTLNGKPGLPSLACVKRAGKDDSGYYIDALQTNIGHWPTNCGTTSGYGLVRERRFRLNENELSPEAQKYYESIKFDKPYVCHNPEMAQCAIENASSVTWYHSGKEENLEQADQGAGDKGKNVTEAAP